MKGIKLHILEPTLLLVLTLDCLKSFQISNQGVILVVASLLLVYFLISFVLVNDHKFENIRFGFLVFFIMVVYAFLLVFKVNSRLVSVRTQDIHDGVIMTEASYLAIVSGVNPYSVNLSPVLTKEKYGKEVSLRPTIHYPYSPMMIIASAPFFVLSENTLGFIDMRVVLVVFFFLASFVASKMVNKKTLFLLLFALNPLFVPLLFYGANDVIVLFLFFVLVHFLRVKKITFASLILGLIIGTKLLFLPFVPVYFLYLLIGLGKRGQDLVKQVSIFLLISCVIYLPFMLWNSPDAFNALFSPWFGGGVEAYPIAGFVGVAQILHGLGFVSQSSTFPFLIFALPVEMIFLYFAQKSLKKSPGLDTFILLCVLSLIIILAFSRIVQTYYIAFVSEILLFASFARTDLTKV